MSPTDKKESPGRANAGGMENTELSGRNDDAAPSAVKSSAVAQATLKRPRYFLGLCEEKGRVSALPDRDWGELVARLKVPIRRTITQAELLALPKDQQNLAKATDYIVPCAFKDSPSPRTTDRATEAHLLCLDIDESREALRMLEVGMAALLGDLNALAWHTARSTPQAPRLRVVVPVDAISVTMYGKAVIALATRLGIASVNKESKVPVQPMYLPVQFKGSDSPIIYFKTDGVPFSASGIDELTDLTANGATTLAVGDAVDSDYLRAPLAGVTLEDAQKDLEPVSADCEYNAWVEVGMGLKHQFGDQGYVVWDRWSRTAPSRYPGAEVTKAKWESFDRNPPRRVPATYQKVRNLARAAKRKLILPGGVVSISDCATALFAAAAENRDIFFRGGAVHEVVFNSAGTAHLSPLTPSAFRSRMEKYGTLLVWRVGADGKPVLKPTTCPEETAKALLASEAARKLLPNISIISACPVLIERKGGAEVLSEGWHDHQGGIYVSSGEIPPKIDLAEAVESLLALISDYQFVEDGDRSRAIAAMLAPAMRVGGWLRYQLPVDIAEADASQSGKGYRQKVNAALYRETPNLVVQKSGGVGGFDESLSQKLIDGRPFVLLDNLRGKLDSQFLEAIITAPGTAPARVPHRGEIQVDARSFVFQLTSNGLETTGDLANRASIIRIRKQPVSYKFRQFPEGDLHAHVVARQPYYLGCIFKVITEWARLGKPRSEETKHAFREWAQSMDWIVQKLFRSAPLLEGLKEAQQRVGDMRSSWIRNIIVAVMNSPRSAPWTASQLAEFAAENELAPPGVRPDSDETAHARVIGRIFAGAFGDRDELEIDGYMITRIHNRALNGNDNKSYRFTRIPHPYI